MCITGDAFADPLRKLMEKNVATTLIFDCCFSGHMYRGETLINDPEFKITAVKQVRNLPENFCYTGFSVNVIRRGSRTLLNKGNGLTSQGDQ